MGSVVLDVDKKCVKWESLRFIIKKVMVGLFFLSTDTSIISGPRCGDLMIEVLLS